jgi:hypothetical protein
VHLGSDEHAVEGGSVASRARRTRHARGRGHVGPVAPAVGSRKDGEMACWEYVAFDRTKPQKDIAGWFG